MIFDNTGLENSFPRQKVSFAKKTKKWYASCVNSLANHDLAGDSAIRQDRIHKMINYDLLNGKLHIEDLKHIIDPNSFDFGSSPENIQHYPIMNSKLQVLQGEESKRLFDYSVVITNPTSVSSIEENKQKELAAKLQEVVQNQNLSEEEAQAKMEEIYKYFRYKWKDIREIRANALLSHYNKELNIPYIFNQGFRDAEAVGEELYQVSIVSGEPYIERITPKKLTIYRSGFSNRVEDADVVVIEDYWSKGKILDYFHNELTDKDLAYIEDLEKSPMDDAKGVTGIYGGYPSSQVEPTVITQDEDGNFKFKKMDEKYTAEELFSEIDYRDSLMPYDMNGNIRVTQVFWKSYRCIKNVKSYDPETGEKVFTLMPEDYIPNKDMGEEAKDIWINQACRGVKIGEKVFVQLGPCPVQYNRLSNPSRCHFGIIGSIYNLNDDEPFSLVDVMKPYNYMYDVVYDRLNKLIARNHGKVIKVDLAQIPDKWGMERWFTVLKTAGIAVIDSFKEGNKGQATGKLAGSLNNNSNGVIDAELGQSIMNHIQLLEYIRNEMSEVVGISKQREGQIANRETVGGVERATLQSSHITEWLFVTHEDLKKRVYEAFLETAKIALKGKSKKFNYILSDGTSMIIKIDGDEFAESDYGLVVDNTNDAQDLKNNLPRLVEIGLQSNKVSFKAAIDIWSAKSQAEKIRILADSEEEIIAQQQQAQQEQLKAQQQQAQMQAELEQQKLQLQQAMNTENNETKILIASMQANNAANVDTQSMTEGERASLDEKIREFNANLSFQKDKLNKEMEIKRKQLNKPVGGK